MDTRFHFVEYSKFAHPALVVVEVYKADEKDRLSADWFWADGSPTERISMLDMVPVVQPVPGFGGTDLLLAICKEQVLAFARAKATPAEAPSTFEFPEANKLRLHAMRSMGLFPKLIQHQNSREKTMSELLGSRTSVGGA